jgi:DNA-binding transcriptional ArsR family regulator
VLRIRLDLDDLGRVRLGRRVADPIEAVYSSQALRLPDAVPLAGRWRARIAPRLRPDVGVLFEVMPRDRPAPAFLVRPGAGLEEVVEGVHRMPARTLLADLQAVHGRHPTRSVTALGRGDGAARRELATALTSYFRAFAVDLPAVRTLVAADLARRTATLAAGGMAALLDSLHPALRWRPPFIEVDGPGADLVVGLAGRPLRVEPALFLGPRPQLLLRDDTQYAYLTYPVLGTPRFDDAGTSGSDGLVDLVGRTRAAALRALRTECTTTGLARRLGMSPATASEHAAVLRRAGLITTTRTGRSVRHQLTSLGLAMLSADPADPPSGFG